MNKKLILFGIAAIAGGVAYLNYTSETSPTDIPREDSDQSAANTEGPIVSVQVPELQGNAILGETIFNNVCAACHGQNAQGQQGVAPPLVHDYYRPGHHSDEAFQRAAVTGVRSHHWTFGDMPPIQDITRGDIAMVIDYIRQLQRANGIN